MENRSLGGHVRKRVAIQFVDDYEARYVRPGHEVTSIDLLYFYRHTSTPWWLTENVQIQLELYRFAYAELLFRWGDVDRLSVLALCRTARDDNRKLGKYALELLMNANGLGASTSISACFSCSQSRLVHLPMLGESFAVINSARPHQVLTCALCHLAVSGAFLGPCQISTILVLIKPN